jgi:ATP-binding cassette, subfamily B (MDR/TAP), member 1
MAFALAAANRILSFRAWHPYKGSQTNVLNATGNAVEVEFKDVHFQYQSRDIPVFSGLNFKVGEL